jgi:hypothetical protein
MDTLVAVGMFTSTPLHGVFKDTTTNGALEFLIDIDGESIQIEAHLSRETKREEPKINMMFPLLTKGFNEKDE